MCDKAMDDIELMNKSIGHAENEIRKGMCLTHLWSQPTICERTS